MKRTARIRGRVWHWLRIAKEEVTARQVGRLCCWVGAVVRLRQIGISGFHIADMAGEDNCSAAERSIIRRAAVLTTELEPLEVKVALAGEASAHNLDLFSRAAANLRASMRTATPPSRSICRNSSRYDIVPACPTEKLGLQASRYDFQQSGYGGPCPPRGHGMHHYHFRLLALSVDRLSISPRPSCREVEREARKYSIAEATLVGVYQR